MGIFIFKTEQNTTELLIYFNKLIYGVYLCLRLYIEYLLYLGYWNIYTDIFKVSNERQLVSVLSVCVVFVYAVRGLCGCIVFSFVVACAVRTLSWRCLAAVWRSGERTESPSVSCGRHGTLSSLAHRHGGKMFHDFPRRGFGQGRTCATFVLCLGCCVLRVLFHVRSKSTYIFIYYCYLVLYKIVRNYNVLCCGFAAYIYIIIKSLNVRVGAVLYMHISYARQYFTNPVFLCVLHGGGGNVCSPSAHKLRGRRSIVIVQHWLQAARKIVAERARVLLTVRHERGNAQQQQHQRLNGQRGAQHAPHEAVAARQHGGVDGLVGCRIRIRVAVGVGVGSTAPEIWVGFGGVVLGIIKWWSGIARGRQGACIGQHSGLRMK